MFAFAFLLCVSSFPGFFFVVLCVSLISLLQQQLQDSNGRDGELVTLDFNNPTYLYPSDTLGTQLVSHHLMGHENYVIWSRSMQIALLAKNKLDFVDRSCSRESVQSIFQSQWDLCNVILLSWILRSVNIDLYAGIMFATNVAQVWKDLKERYDKVNQC
ncbi:hypothetical protein PVK06_036650 [Gossypium arboreum]|uniref:Retrotransposon Copia-like N-terminal domain-containing protein n=1 Tax=Gossypium arboreum TaxID=29729 RepID=A0ABR0NK28_GOSAR|nr:hypothetical protein PVK06_036650 [Gossypium arboreum]